MRALLCLALLTSSLAAIAAKPAAVQVCLKLPTGMELFSASPAAHHRELAPGTFMLDVDVHLDGAVVERVTPAKGPCVRVWVQATTISRISVDTTRVPLNLVANARDVKLNLKPDLFYDGGQITLEAEPFATVTNRARGVATFRRETPDGPRVEEPSALPTGKYTVTFEATPPPRVACSTRVALVAMGSVTRENDPKTVAALEENYAAQLLPGVLSDQKIDCAPDEEVIAEVIAADGIYVRPLQPKLTKRIVEARRGHTVLHHHGTSSPLDLPVTMEVAPGEHFEIAEIDAGGPQTPPVARR